MGRIRSIHPGIWTNEDFAELSDGAKLLLMGLWGEADDGGIFEWRPVRLKMRLRAWDGGSIDHLLAEISDSDAVKRFEVDGRSYGAIKNFTKWQRPKSPQLLHPCPANLVAYLGTVTETEKPERSTVLAKILCEKQGGECHYCRTEITFYRKKITSLEIDHVIPLSHDGEDDINNLCAACKPCNSLKNSMTEEEFRARFTVEEMRVNSDAKRNSQNAKDNSQHCERPVTKCENTVRTVAKTLRGEATIQMEDGGGRMEESPLPPSDPTELIERALGLEPVKPKSKALEAAMEAAGMMVTPTDWCKCFDTWSTLGCDFKEDILPVIRDTTRRLVERGAGQPRTFTIFDRDVREKLASDEREIERLKRVRTDVAEADARQAAEDEADRTEEARLTEERRASG